MGLPRAIGITDSSLPARSIARRLLGSAELNGYNPEAFMREALTRIALNLTRAKEGLVKNPKAEFPSTRWLSRTPPAAVGSGKKRRVSAENLACADRSSPNSLRAPDLRRRSDA